MGLERLVYERLSGITLPERQDDDKIRHGNGNLKPHDDVIASMCNN